MYDDDSYSKTLQINCRCDIRRVAQLAQYYRNQNISITHLTNIINHSLELLSLMIMNEQPLPSATEAHHWLSSEQLIKRSSQTRSLIKTMAKESAEVTRSGLEEALALVRRRRDLGSELDRL